MSNVSAKEITCSGAFARWMRSRGWAGVTLVLPWIVRILYWEEPSQEERLHEWRHVLQAKRWGFWGFWARYLWGLRKGYRNNPLEIEARNET